MAQQKRSILDDIIEAGREIMDELDKILNPQRRQPARVPVPVRNHPPVPDEQR